MVTPKIQHLGYRAVRKSHVFDKVDCYDALERAIAAFGSMATCLGAILCQDPECLHGDTRDNRVGMAFEVFCEAFLRWYGMKGIPSPTYIVSGHSLQDTSQDKWNVGYDFSFKGPLKTCRDTWYVQVKYRSDPSYKFTRADLGSFISKCDEDDVPKHRRVLFTNLIHQPGNNDNGIFHSSYAGGLKQMLVFGRYQQEKFLDTDPSALDLLTLKT